MGKRVLVTGATGQLGAYLVRELSGREASVVAWGHSRRTEVCGFPTMPVDLTDRDQLATAFGQTVPDVVIHAAAMAAVGDCARDPHRAAAVNIDGTAALAELCDTAGTRLVFVSTDLVFDGEGAPYAEDVPPMPLSVYGRTKAAAELTVLASRRNVDVRISLLFGPSLNGKLNFFDTQVTALRNGQPVRLFHDEWRTPLGLSTAARALVDVATSDMSGLLHIGGPERMSRLEMSQRLAVHLGLQSNQILAVSRSSAGGEPRPRDTSLDSTRWRDSFPEEPWPTFEQELAEMGVA